MSQAMKRRRRKERDERDRLAKIARREALEKLPTVLFFYASRSFMDPDFIKTGFWTEILNMLISAKKIKDYRMVWHDPQLKEQYVDGRFIGYNTWEIPILPSDIIFLRGSQSVLKTLTNNNNWRIAYRGGTKQQVPGTAHITFDDFEEDVTIVDNMLILPLMKPPSSMFDFGSKVFDYNFCIGGNNVYDKKGQYKSYATIMLYDRWANKFSHCICPGAVWTENPGTRVFVQQDVEFPGIVKRNDMIDIYHRSKIFIHTTNNGQNDRCITEALACGCPVMMHKDSYQFFPSYIRDCPYIVPFDNNDPLAIIEGVNRALSFNRKAISDFAKRNYGIQHLYKIMEKLVKYIKDNNIPKVDEQLRSLYVN